MDMRRLVPARTLSSQLSAVKSSSASSLISNFPAATARLQGSVGSPNITFCTAPIKAWETFSNYNCQLGNCIPREIETAPETGTVTHGQRDCGVLQVCCSYRDRLPTDSRGP